VFNIAGLFPEAGTAHLSAYKTKLTAKEAAGAAGMYSR